MGIFKQAYLNEKEEMLPYYYWLCRVGDIGIKHYVKMQSYFSSPRDLFEASVSKLNESKVFTETQKARILEARKNYDVKNEYLKLAEKGIRIIVRESGEYPERLKEIPNSPIALFIKGNFPQKEVPLVSIIGARECSFYGMQVATRLGELFAENGICVVSGMARGIDSIAQESCVRAGGSSIAVLGGGVDVIYPKESASLYNTLSKRGAIISEYPPGTEPQKPFFALRNRIISGISDVVCVIEAREKSGTMITVDAALEQGREVYALPGKITDVTSRGCNELIRQGAGVISNLESFVSDITCNFSVKSSTENTETCTFNIEETRSEYECDILIESLDEQSKRLIVSMDEESFTAEQIAVGLSLLPGEVLLLCTKLSVKKVLINMGAGRFRLSDKGTIIRRKLLNF